MVPDRAENGSPLSLAVIGVICVALFASLFVRLYYLQIIDHQTFQVQSKAVHFRTKHEEGPRGRILDRNGKVLVDNQVVVVVGIDKEIARGEGLGNGDATDSEEELAKRKKVFQRLAGVLTQQGVPRKVTAIEAIYTDVRYGPNDFLPIVDEGVSEELKTYLAERHEEFPGIIAKARTIRVYPYGQLAAHILGYVGQIIPEELERSDIKAHGTPAKPAGPDAKPYALDDQIGKSGVERAFEQYLRGTPGDTVIQVDARGQSLGIVKEPKLRQGDDLWLTIDIDKQALVEQRLREEIQARSNCPDASDCRAKEGSAVLINPQNGQVEAMASYPTFDPSELVNGISTDLWESLNSKENGKRMLNRATAEGYAPGSTFKLVTTHAALSENVITPEDVYEDKGYYALEGCTSGKCEFQNAGRERLGAVNLQRALTVSSDTYFYRIADLLWRGRAAFGDTPIQDSAKLFGFGQKTGINLPSESAGLIGTPEWLQTVYDKNPKLWDHGKWTVGDNINTSIGQGLVNATPLQLANAYATFANGGTRYVPQIALRVTRPKSLAKAAGGIANVDLIKTFEPQVAGTLQFPDQHQYEVVYAGLQGVASAGSGTASDAFDAYPTAWATVAGKTGTAEVDKKADTSLFVGFGPATGFEPVQYVMSAVIPEGGFGGEAAAPLVASVFQRISRGEVPPVAGAPIPGAVVGEPLAPAPTTTVPQVQISDGSTPATTATPSTEGGP
ncbi:MAG: penicillin-binding protein 2 [Microthrixaceae bacterium]|nr:penicillin-binding protein 2 [Microthrixaceae bacterium]